MLGAPSWDALLFDFDGVLADSEPVHHRAWNQTLEPLGIQLDWPDYRKNFVGISDEIALRDRLHIAEGGEALVARKQDLFRQGLAAAQPFLPETLAMLQELFRLYTLAVVSSSYRSEVEPPLVRAGIHQAAHVLGAADNGRPGGGGIAPDPLENRASIAGDVRQDVDLGVVP
ncbi:MAG TPA: HAD family phosphatase, partial [Bryobacteraceae bacterium]